MPLEVYMNKTENDYFYTIVICLKPPYLEE